MGDTVAARRAIGYARVSSEGQAEEGSSLPAQRAELERYCRERGLELEDVITDAAVSSGLPLDRRPGLVRVLERLESRGGPGHLVITRLDRAVRSPIEALTVGERVQARGATLHLVSFLGAPVDLSTTTGRFVFGQFALSAELERGMLRDRTREVLGYMRRAGRVVGHIPYGFRRQGDHLAPEPAEQRVLEVARRLREDDRSYAAIARALNDRELLTRGGRPWSRHTVRQVLVRPRPPVSGEACEPTAS